MASATIQRIESISPIENADQIEKAGIMGWTCVVRKGESKPGDACVYVEIDSLVPKAPWSMFLFPESGSHAKDLSIRIKTKKLRGVLSQGLVLPLTILPGVCSDEEKKCVTDMGLWDPTIPPLYTIGQDVSEVLNVQHYTKPEPTQMKGYIARSFPVYVPKTDETLLQSCLPCLQEMVGHDVSLTVKCDGTSSTVAFKDSQLDACSRTQSYKIEAPENEDLIYVFIPKKVGLLDLLSKLGLNIAVQGEICGPGIQKNRLGFKEKTLLVFDIWDIDAQKYWEYYRVKTFCDQHELQTVPELKIVQGFNLDLDHLLELAQGNYEGTQNRREGIVVRPLVPVFSETLGKRLSFKVMNNQFLLKDD